MGKTGKRIYGKYIKKIVDKFSEIPKDLKKKQILVLGVSLLLTVFSCLNELSESSILPGGGLMRGTYGEADTSYDLMVSGLNEDEELPVSVTVSSRRYTQDEADEVFSEILQKIEGIITDPEDSLDGIRRDLKLPGTFTEYGVDASWDYYPVYEVGNEFYDEDGNEIDNGIDNEDNNGDIALSEGSFQKDMPTKNVSQKNVSKEDVSAEESEKDKKDKLAQEYYQKYRYMVDMDGTVHNESLKDGEAVSGYLTLVLSTFISPKGEEDSEYLEKRYKSEAYKIYIQILPRVLTEKEKLEKALEEALAEKNAANTQLDHMVLPNEVAGHSVYFSEKQDNSYLYFPLLGVLVAAGLYVSHKSKLKEDRKRREDQLLLDYSELVSKLMVYIGAGLTIRNAFQKISSRYDSLVEGGGHEDRYLYQELRVMKTQFDRNEAESEVYISFGKRVNLKPYTKLVSLIEQNRKNGSKNLKSLFRIEMDEAFEQRKNTAKRLGEEAGTKLLGPLFMQLGIVMAIIIIPAMTALT